MGNKYDSVNVATISLLAGVAFNSVFCPAHAHHAPSTTLDSGASHAIVTDSAVPLAKGQWNVGVQIESVQFDRLSDGQLIELREADPNADLHSVDSLVTTTFNAAHGLTDRVTIGLAVPYVTRDDIREPPHADGGREQAHEEPGHEESGLEIEMLGDSSGIGDATLFGLWRVIHRARTDTHLAVLFGVKAPTGRTSEHADSGEPFEAELQPGTGSWDSFVGLGFSHKLGKFTVDTSARYTLVTEGSQDTDLGDVFAYNVGATYEMPRRNPDSPALNLVTELNGEWRDKLETDGYADRNSGGHLVYLSPGVSLNGKRWNISATVGYPVIDEPDGDQDERDFRFLVGVQWKPGRPLVRERR